MGHPQKETSIPTIHFQGHVSFREANQKIKPYFLRQFPDPINFSNPPGGHSPHQHMSSWKDHVPNLEGSVKTTIDSLHLDSRKVGGKQSSPEGCGIFFGSSGPYHQKDVCQSFWRSDTPLYSSSSPHAYLLSICICIYPYVFACLCDYCISKSQNLGDGMQHAKRQYAAPWFIP